MNGRFVTGAIIVVSALCGSVWLNGCGITESEQPETGVLHVSAWDTTTGQAIVGADILLNGSLRQERTPATIRGLQGGQYELTVTPPELNYPALDTSITIVPPDTQTVTMMAGPSSDPGYLQVFASPASATIHVDYRFEGHASGSVLTILPGEHLVSAWAVDHAVELPGLVTAAVRAADTTRVQLTLSAEEPGIGTGQLAPDLLLTGDLGNDYSLAQYRGAVLLLNFAGFQCDPCLNELPDIQWVYEQHFDDGFRVLVINIGWFNDGPDEFARIRESLNLSMPLLFADTPDGNATTIYNITAAPTNIVIDRRGIVRHRLGAVDADQLEQLIEPLLEVSF